MKTNDEESARDIVRAYGFPTTFRTSETGLHTEANIITPFGKTTLVIKKQRTRLLVSDSPEMEPEEVSAYMNKLSEGAAYMLLAKWKKEVPQIAITN